MVKITKELRQLYSQFLQVQRDSLIEHIRNTNKPDERNNLTDKTIRDVYDAYYRPPFFAFLRDLKTAIYSHSIFNFVKAVGKDSEYGADFVELFKKTKIAKLDKNGKVIVLKKNILKALPRPQTEKEIKRKIEKTLKIKVKENAFATDLIANIAPFRAKSELDQLSISQGSAIFVVKKILENLPLPGNFLFVGDDDFISIFLAIADPSVSSIVIDADEELLAAIDNIAKQYKLNIKTRKGDVRKKDIIKEPIVGFLCNPPYTHKGVEAFINYGVNNFGEDGGIAILVVGDEAIGHRFLPLQDFFTGKNLVIKELAKGAVHYPFLELYPSDAVVKNKFLSVGISKRTVETAPHLGASIYVFDYIPYKVESSKIKQSIYSYL